jgi:hypothetical protein
MSIPFKVTTSVDKVLMITPLVPAARMPVKLPVPSTVIDLVIVIVPIEFADTGIHTLGELPGEWRLFAVERKSSGQ